MSAVLRANNLLLATAFVHTVVFIKKSLLLYRRRKLKKKQKMKTRSDPRHIARIKTMQALFSFDFNDGETGVVKPIIKHLSAIDKQIYLAAPAFPIDKIAKVDLAILRLALFELLFEKKNPPKVIIDEAVELAKEFGNDTSGSFVNGVLGTILAKGGQKWKKK